MEDASFFIQHSMLFIDFSQVLFFTSHRFLWVSETLRGITLRKKSYKNMLKTAQKKSNCDSRSNYCNCLISHCIRTS